MDETLGLLRHVQDIERRRHAGTAILSHLVGMLGGAKKSKVVDYLPFFAREPTVEHPPGVMQDLRTGIALGMVSQELVDDLEEVRLAMEGKEDG